jgi:hypothetical protein
MPRFRPLRPGTRSGPAQGLLRKEVKRMYIGIGTLLIIILLLVLFL